jgi:hypothetical protein
VCDVLVAPEVVELPEDESSVAVAVPVVSVPVLLADESDCVWPPVLRFVVLGLFVVVVPVCLAVVVELAVPVCQYRVTQMGWLNGCNIPVVSWRTTRESTAGSQFGHADTVVERATVAVRK